MKKLAEGVVIFPLITRDYCNWLISRIVSYPWEQGKVRNNGQKVVNTAQRKNYAITCSEHTPDLVRYTTFATKIPSLVHGPLGVPGRLVPQLVQFQRSSVGDFHDWHTDASATDERKLVAITYLSDSGLEGGETEFEIDGQSFSVKPSSGLCVAFRPTLRHRGTVVQRGTKYTLVTTFRQDPCIMAT